MEGEVQGQRGGISFVLDVSSAGRTTIMSDEPSLLRGSSTGTPIQFKMGKRARVHVTFRLINRFRKLGVVGTRKFYWDANTDCPWTMYFVYLYCIVLFYYVLFCFILFCFFV